MNFIFLAFIAGLLNFLLVSCSGGSSESANPENTEQPPKTCLNQWDLNSEWSNEQEVQISGYSQSAMEPKVAADGGVLFWNDKPAGGDTLMNIHYAVKQADQSWLYIGTVPGTVDNSYLDGVPALDSSLNFYFISTRSYATNQQTIYSGLLSVLGANSLGVSSVTAADTAIKNTQSGFLDMDLDVSWDGTLMVVSRALFAGNPYPETSELKLFSVSTRQASNISNSNETLANVNSTLCRTYAGTLSNDKKELYFTIIPSTSIAGSDFRILVAKRATITEPFGKPQVIQAITGTYMEGPSLTQDGKNLYYHKFDSAAGRFKIYKVTR